MASNAKVMPTNVSDEDCRVLSIQSIPVFGYVGNKSATFPLQVFSFVSKYAREYLDRLAKMLGFDVSAINSVQSSNHSEYEHRTAQDLDAQDVEDLFHGLRLNNLMQFSYVLTGYCVTVCFLEKVGDTIAEMKKMDPNLVYLCDPVIGDNGQFYAPKEMVPVYRDKMIPQADIITPNQFELEQLAGMAVSSEGEAFAAIDSLHARGIQTVVLSSSTLGTEGILLCLASSALNGRKRRYRLEIPRVNAIFYGTGDLFSACLLAWTHKEEDLKLALEKTVATVQAVIKKTFDYATKAAGPGNIPSCAQLELRLIHCKKAIEDPQVEIYAQDVTSLYSS